MFDLLIILFASYYLVAILTRTDGPAGIFYKLRQKSYLPLKCELCLIFWVSLAMYCLSFLSYGLIAVLAVAGAYVFIRDVINWYDA